MNFKNKVFIDDEAGLEVSGKADISSGAEKVLTLTNTVSTGEEDYTMGVGSGTQYAHGLFFLNYGATANSSQKIFTAKDDGSVSFNTYISGGATATEFIVTGVAIGGSPVGSETGLRLGAGTQNKGQITAISGEKIFVDIGAESNAIFAPTSGTATVKWLELTPIINQTSTASGLATGLAIDATLTSVTGEYRAIDVMEAGVSVFSIGEGGTTTIAQSIINENGVIQARNVFEFGTGSTDGVLRNNSTAGDIDITAGTTSGELRFNASGALALTINATQDVTIASGQLLLPNGTEAAPSLVFSSATNTGFNYQGTTSFNVVLGGSETYRFKTTSFRQIGSGADLGESAVPWGTTFINRLDLTLTTGDVGSPLEGQMWYNDTTNKFRVNENGSVVDMIAGGSSAGVNNEIQTSDGSGGFTASSLTYVDSTGVYSIGDTSTSAGSRTIQAIGSATDIDIWFVGKGNSDFYFRNDPGAIILNGLTSTNNLRFLAGSQAIYGEKGTSPANLSITSSGGISGSIDAMHLGLYGGAAYGTGDGDGGHVFLRGGTGNDAGINGNISIHSNSASYYGGGERVIYLADADTNPTTNPTSGGILYSDSGDSSKLKWRVPGGTTYDLTDAGGGTVTASGSPLNDQIATFTSGTDIDSHANFTFNQSTGVLHVAGSGGQLNTSANSSIAIQSTNTTNSLVKVETTNTTANAKLHLKVPTEGADPYIMFDVSATTSFAMGIDNSGGDSLKIRYNAGSAASPSSGTTYFGIAADGAYTFNSNIGGTAPAGSYLDKDGGWTTPAGASSAGTINYVQLSDGSGGFDAAEDLSGAIATISTTTATNTSQVTAFKIYSNTTHASDADDGFGTAIQMGMDTSTGGDGSSAIELRSVWADASLNYAQFEVHGWQGTQTPFMKISNDEFKIYSTNINLTDAPVTDASFSTSTILVRNTSGIVVKLGASGGGSTNFLRADGTWAAAGGGAWTSSGGYTYLDTLTDNVGIGVTTPDHQIEIKGIATPTFGQYKQTANDSGGISMLTYSADNSQIYFDAQFIGSAVKSLDNGSSAVIRKTGDALFIGYDTATIGSTLSWNTSLFVDLLNGYVGIGGVTDPDMPLHVVSNGSGQVMTLSRGTGRLNFLMNNNADFGFISNSTSDLFLTLDGTNERIGIGTLTPNALLSVGGSGVTGAFSVEGTGSGNIMRVTEDSGENIFDITGEFASTYAISIGDYDGVGDGAFMVINEDEVILNTGGSDRLTVDNGGDIIITENVGIGTTGPNASLHLNESTSGGIAIDFTNSSTGTTVGSGLTIGMDGSENAFMWHREDNDIYFGTGVSTAERMRISYLGYITTTGGIVATMGAKTTAYTLLLADNGKIIEFNTASVNVTFPQSGFPNGWNVQIVNIHATGVLTFVTSGTATMSGKGTKLASQYGGATVYHRSGDDYVAIGDLTT